MCVLDEFSEYLLETRFNTSADFNTYPIRIFFLSSLFYRPSNSSQMRMSTTDLRAGGISGPTGFVHVSGYGRAYQPGRCSSISGTPMMSPPRESRGRARELSNIDPKFTSQVRPKYKDLKYSVDKGPADAVQIVEKITMKAIL